MENLVGRKVRCLTSRWDDLTLNKVYDINKETHFNFYITNDDLFQDEFSKHHLDNSSFELLVDEPQFKLGDKVLVSDDEMEWNERYYTLFFNNKHYVQSKHSESELTNWQYIKPYEEEIKIGDWVKRVNDKTIWLIENKEDIDLAKRTDCTKITNLELIELLNKEL